jgi:hypothetical protein
MTVDFASIDRRTLGSRDGSLPKLRDGDDFETYQRIFDAD